MNLKRQAARALAATALCGASAIALAADDAAVERTKKQIMMLDDLYKTAVVLITEHYVKDPTTLSAATASKAIFKAMKEKGWHEARLLGYTDILINAAEDTPGPGFDTKAKEKIMGGDASYSEVVEDGGKRYVQMATAVPVVMEKCVMCHANFKDNKGAIGAISYKVPVIE
jgi:hypothetical protein